MVSWVDPINSPPMLFRIVFLIAVIIPAWFFTRVSIPIVFGFYCVAYYGFGATFMPNNKLFYGIIFLILFLISKNRTSIAEKYRISPPIVFLVFVAYMVFVDFLMDAYMNSFAYVAYFVLFLCFYAIHPIDRISVTSFSMMFALSSIVLAIYFYFGRSMYTERVVFEGAEMESMAWTDPNYFSMVVGMGMVASIVELSRNKSIYLIQKIIYILSIIGSLFVFSASGSRGALVAIIGMLLIYMLFSNVKIRYKLLFSCFGLIIIYFLYAGNYFELLLFKINNDATISSGRSEIWSMKLNLFFQEGNALNYLFGIGYKNGKELGQLQIGNAVMFHNDYLACFISYGFVGLLIFAYIMTKPLFWIKRGHKDNPLIISCLVYLILCGFSVEPLTGGHFMYYLFYLYICLLAHKSKYMIA